MLTYTSFAGNLPYQLEKAGAKPVPSVEQLKL
jgi:hypothetical protein